MPLLSVTYIQGWLQVMVIRSWSLHWKGSLAELCHIWTIMCRKYDTQYVRQGQLNLIFKNLFGMITEWSPTFSPKYSNNICSLRYYTPTLSCSVHITRTFCKKTDCEMKCKFSQKTFQQPDLWVTYTDSIVRSKVESIEYEHTIYMIHICNPQ
jgi:hypothetical protein